MLSRRFRRLNNIKYTDAAGVERVRAFRERRPAACADCASYAGVGRVRAHHAQPKRQRRRCALRAFMSCCPALTLAAAAVVVFAVLRRAGEAPHTLLVRQFRPPVSHAAVLCTQAALTSVCADGRPDAGASCGPYRPRRVARRSCAARAERGDWLYRDGAYR